MRRDPWGWRHEGLRTKKRRKIGGAPLTLSGVYKIFNNPFYAGVLEWDGRTYAGKHPAMVTLDEFDRVQEILGNKRVARPKHFEFAYTGLIRCGECGFAVTAEEKTNRWGSMYTYYHCSRRRLDYRCRQPYVRLEDLESQIHEFLTEIAPPEDLHRWAIEQFERLGQDRRSQVGNRRQALEGALAANARELDTLTQLRLRDLLTDEEYVRQREALQRKRIGLTQNLERVAQHEDWFEPAKRLMSFNKSAVSAFADGDPRTKRFILTRVGSNLELRDEKLRIDAKKPFRRWTGTENISDWRKGRDSNPRDPCGPTCFRDKPIRPLWHPSITWGSRRPFQQQSCWNLPLSPRHKSRLLLKEKFFARLRYHDKVFSGKAMTRTRMPTTPFCCSSFSS